MTIRKNFLFEQKVAEHLAEIAKLEGKTQTQIAQEAIEARYKQISINHKLAMLEEINDSLHGRLTNIEAKRSRLEHTMEKYGK